MGHETLASFLLLRNMGPMMPFSRTTDRTTFTHNGESSAGEETLSHYVPKLLAVARNDSETDQERKGIHGVVKVQEWQPYLMRRG